MTTVATGLIRIWALAGETMKIEGVSSGGSPMAELNTKTKMLTPIITTAIALLSMTYHAMHWS